jgi:carbonic anhydrase
MLENKFATAVTCMDGRIQVPVIEYIKSNYGVEYVDMITEPGPNKILSDNTDTSVVESIRRRVEISVKAHGSRIIAIIGHYDCAGNQTDKETQLNHLHRSISLVKKWGFNAHIICLWVDEAWQVHEIDT